MFGKNNSIFDVAHYIIIGFLQGVALYYLFEVLAGGSSWATSQFAAVLWALVMPAAYLFTSTPATRVQSAIFSLALATAIALLHIVSAQIVGGEPGDMEVRIASVFGAELLTYVGVCYFRAAMEDEGVFDYASLFKHAWNLPLIIAASGAFLLGFWIVLVLWAALFNLIDIEFFENIFEKTWFIWPVSCAIYAVGVSIVRKWEGVILSLRAVVIVLLRFIAPVLTLACFVFLPTLTVTGLEPLWDATSATITTFILIAIAILMINAIIGDKTDAASVPHRYLALTGKAQSLILPVFAFIAPYSLWLRGDQYGWTVPRIYAALFVSIAAIYAMTYALAIFTPGWAKTIEKINIALSIFVAALVIAIQTPLLNPYQISAANLIQRLDVGKVGADAFDYGYLKFKLGRAGEKALAELKSNSERRDYAVITSQLALLHGSDNYYEWKRAYRNGEDTSSGPEVAVSGMLGSKILVFPDGHAPTTEIIRHLQSHPAKLEHCKDRKGQDRPCILLAADLLGDEKNEYVWVDRNADSSFTSLEVNFYSAHKQAWQTQELYRTIYDSNTYDELLTAIEVENYQLFDIELRGIQIGKHELTFQMLNLLELRAQEPEPPE
jgi:hypothetical protein